jgi:hypothetical protein
MFTPISPSEIEVGEAIKKELWDKVKVSLDDLDARLTPVEVISGKVTVFKFPIVNASSFSTLTGITYFTADFPFNLVSAYIQIFEKGSLTGTLEIDVRRSTTDLNGPSFSSVFTTRPSINVTTASNYAQSTNAVFDVTQNQVQAGNHLRLDITSMPSGGTLGKFLLTVIGESA